MEMQAVLFSKCQVHYLNQSFFLNIMFGFDGNTTFAFARPKLLTLSREALVDIIFDLYDQPEDLMSRLNGISDKRSTVNHFLTQPDHVTSYILSHLDVVEL